MLNILCLFCESSDHWNLFTQKKKNKHKEVDTNGNIILVLPNMDVHIDFIFFLYSFLLKI